jgi:predicted DNA-binding transcriptional regulator YafY
MSIHVGSPVMANDPYAVIRNVLDLLRRLGRAPGRALPVNELAEEFGVHRRTILRWARTLAEDDEPWVVREHRDGAAWIRLRAEPLSAGIFQFAATYAATRVLAAGKDPVLALSAETVVERVRDSLSPADRKLIGRVASAFHYVPFAPKSYSDKEDILDVLVRGALRCRVVRASYRSASGKAFEESIEPYTLVLYRDALYVLARTPGARKLRIFAVDRFQKAKLVEGESFTVRTGFTPAEAIGDLGLWQGEGNAVEVVLAFRADAVLRIRERTWPGLKGWRTLEDGREAMTVTLHVTPEVVTWILGWGSAVEVLRPPSLRTAVAEELQKAWHAYEAR